MHKVLNLTTRILLKEGLLGVGLLAYRRIGVVIFQLFLVILAYGVSFLVRFEFSIPPSYFEILLKTLPMLVVARMAAYYYYGIYSGWWRFVSMQDLINISKAVFSGSILFLIIMVFVNRLEGFPRSILLIEALLNLTMTGGIRFFIRFFREYNFKKTFKVKRFVIIAGAGRSGVLVLNEIRTNPALEIEVIGFVDDDPYKKGVSIQGIPILGNTEDIPELVKKHAVDEVIIAIPSASYKDIVRVTEIAHSAQVRAKVLPGLGKLIEEGTFVSQLRDVLNDDLLDRRIVKFRRESDYGLLDAQIKGNAVLVTGAGGSIGSELCRQVAQFNPRILILYDRYENSLYELELGLKKEFPKQALLPVVGDILDVEKFRKIVQTNEVNLIYHAAAYKHVPLMEREPAEAVRNNVIGTLNVTRVAIENKVDKFVMISTDKAVKPTSVMGTTKRVAEMIVQGLSGSGTKFVAVRFGNVIGSNGSVIPIFKKQIAGGGPITVTHPDVTRYFMSISEAVQLVLIAGAMGSGGEIFLLDMGEPVKIVDIAKKLIKFSGLNPAKDVDIVFTGLRPGEKLHEELYWKGEGVVPTENKKITVLRPNGFDSQTLFSQIKKLEEYERSEDVENILNMLKEVVPEARIGNGV